MDALQSLFGFFVLLVLAWSISENRRRLDMRILISGVALQFILAALLLKLPLLKEGFLYLNRLVIAVEEATKAGTSFVFGYLGEGISPSASPRRGRDIFWPSAPCPSSSL